MNSNVFFLHEILEAKDVVLSIKNNMNEILRIVPEIEPMIGFKQNHPHHHLDVWEHTLLALSMSKNNFDVRLCLLLHDIGKPICYQDGTDGVRHFKNHPAVSKNIAEKILRRLGFEEKTINEICYLIKNHDTEISYVDLLRNFKLEEKRFEVQKCDALAHNPKCLDKRKKYIENVENLFKRHSLEKS